MSLIGYLFGVTSGCSQFNDGCECATCKISRICHQHHRGPALKSYWQHCNARRFKTVGYPPSEAFNSACGTRKGITPVFICVYSRGHWGVAIFEKEFSWGGGYIFNQAPEHHEELDFWYKMCVGFTQKSFAEIQQIINKWKHDKNSDFTDIDENGNIDKYGLFINNCRAFSLALVNEIVSHKIDIPFKWDYLVE